jgi:adenylate kinase
VPTTLDLVVSVYYFYNHFMKSEDIKKISQWLGAGSINVFGPPFAGKDTQVNRLASELGASKIGGGNILRSYHDQEYIKRLMSTGELFPPKFYLSVILPYLSRAEFANKPLILSSIGRWHGEEEPVMEAANEAGHPIKAAVLLNISDGQVRERFEVAKQRKDRGKRYDDAGNVLGIRLEEFRHKTLPVIEFYRQKGLLVEVDGSLQEEQVTEQILAGLAKLAAA